MSIFAKKPEWEQKVMAEMGGGGGAPPVMSGGGGYGISDVVQLLRTLPTEASGSNGDLVVRVVRATLSSVNMRMQDIIEDASRKQKTAQDRIVAVHTQIAELERQLASHEKEIATLESDLKELTTVKERLQSAEKLSAMAAKPAASPLASSTSSSPHTPVPVATKSLDEPTRLKD